MAEPNTKKLTILHSNDMHGDFLAEDTDGKLIGGVSLLSGYVSKVRAEEKNTLYCIAGDMFRGSVIDSEFMGLSTIQLMNMLSPDIVTIGNHETDYGIAHLLFIEKCANFPIVNANLYIRQNNARLFSPYKIIEIDGMKILFIGLLTEDVLSQTKGEKLIGSFIDVDDAAMEVGRICDAHNSLDIDFTVLLTHIGWEEDKKLAALLDPAWGVDIIIGGHSHTLPSEPAKVNDILIVQAGTGTDQIGRFDITVDTDHNCIYDYTWHTVPIDDQHCPKDERIEKLLVDLKNVTDQKYNRLITRLRRELTHPDRYRQTDLGSLMADAVNDSIGTDFTLLGSGSVRVEKMGPIVTYGDLTECFPYDDALQLFTLTGAQVKKMLLHIFRDEAWEGDHTEFFQFSKGFEIVYSKSKHELLKLQLNGEDIQDDRLYTMPVQTFHYNNTDTSLGLDIKEVEANAKIRIVATSTAKVIEEYLTEHQNIDAEAGKRLTVVE